LVAERDDVKTGIDERSTADSASADKSRARANTSKVRRLIADQQYFGMEALAFHEGAGRVLARAARSRDAHVDMRSLAEDFQLDELATRTLVRALLSGALLHPDGNGGYRPTERFRQYAQACVVSPLSRGRAKLLLEPARETAERINADWSRNPYVIWTLAVSGSYMTRRRRLHDLSFWLILRRRPQSRRARFRSTLSKEDALLQIASALKALSSFVTVHIAADRDQLQRPFAVIYEMVEETTQPRVASWQRVRQWAASISKPWGHKRRRQPLPRTTRMR
jgi:hypothetical protein